MKSILLTSSSSSDSSTSSSNSQTSNNLSLLAESYSANEDTAGHDDEIGTEESLTETFFVENKLLAQSGSNTKKQVIKNSKIIAKNDDKLTRGDRNIYSDIECEKRWQKATGDVNSDYFSLNFETHPLIDANNVIVGEGANLSSRGAKLIPTVVTQANSTSSASKLINLRKKNGTTLIFQRKNCAQPANDCSEYQELEIESFKKRQSLNWPKSAIPNHAKSNKSRHYSWHDPCNYAQHSIEEEFENSVSNFTLNNLARC